MSSVDDRVVGMKFDNAQFEAGVKQTLASLQALNKSLMMEGATKGFSEVSAAAQHVQLGHIAESVDNIASKFKAMSVIAISALATIASQAVMAGASIAKSLTIDPINQGLQEYQTNINSIQTILSNTRWQNTGLTEVNNALDTLNKYSDQTIYNFSQMARNIGTFTAAGVSLEVATGAIKGIANLAAVSGSNAEQASMAMYQLSQALATGTVKLIDWNSVVNAGMGGKVFQDALMDTARVHGVAIDKMLKDAGSFRSTLEQGWLSADILTETLSHFTGDLTEQQIISMGYTQQQAAEIVAMGKDAQDAATKVKTITQLLSTLREAAGSGWAKTWQLIFGDFEEARSFFTDANNALSAVIQTSADARNALLSDWKAMGGRAELIDALRFAWADLNEVLFIVGKAWRDVFPAMTAKNLYDITHAIKEFFISMRLGEDTMVNLRRTLAGLFSILGIGWDILKQVVRVLFSLFGMLGDGSGNILRTTASIGDFLVALRKAINEGDGLVKFFDGVKRVLTPVVVLINLVAKAIADLFTGFKPGGTADAIVEQFSKMGNVLKPLSREGEILAGIWKKLVQIFNKTMDVLGPIGDALEWVAQKVGGFIKAMTLDDVLHTLNTGALIAFVVVLRNTFGRGGITGIFSQLTSVLSAMQTTLQATTLLEIAIAIGVLAIAVSVLSKVNADDLANTLSAIAIMFTQLLAALAVMTRMPDTNVLKIYITAASLVVLALAIDALVIAVKALSKLDWEELSRGLVGTAALIAAVVAAANFIPESAKLISAGVGMVILAAAVKILASALKDLSGLDWEEMAKGLTGVAGLIGSLTLFSRFAGANAAGIAAGAGLVLLATAIKILASAIIDVSGVSWENIGKGMTVIAGSLILMGIAISSIPPTAPSAAVGVLLVASAILILANVMKSMQDISWGNVAQGMVVIAASLVLIGAALVIISDAAPHAILSAGAILVVAIAMGILADAMEQMGGMSWEEIAKGLVTLGASLTIIVTALLLMPSALPGAFALLVVSGALVVLASVLKTLGGMSWGEIAKGLGALALAFTVLGVAGLLLTPVIPSMIGLGVALALIGGALALVGAGVFLFAAGLQILSLIGPGAAESVKQLLGALLGLIPVIMEQAGVVLFMLIDILKKAVPQIVDLVIDLLIQLLNGIDRMAPSLFKALGTLLNLLIDLLEKAIPRMVEAGLHILLGILEGVRDNIYQIVTVAAQIIVQFLRGISDNLPSVIEAGVQLILSFIRGITAAIDSHAAELGAAGGELAVAIIEGMAKGLWAGTSKVGDAARGVAKSALNAALGFLGISSPSKAFQEVGQFSGEGMALGFRKSSVIVIRSVEDLGQMAVDSMNEALRGILDWTKTEIDTRPVISPILDLTDARKSATQLNALMATKPITVGASYSTAQQVSQGIKDTADPTESGTQVGNTTFNYTQNNTSPVPLSAATIYRQTKNQLSTVKGVLP